MFDGGRYKRMAKTMLKGRLTVAVLATLITLVITGLVSWNNQQDRTRSWKKTFNNIERNFDFSGDSDDYSQSAGFIPQDSYDYEFHKSLNVNPANSWQGTVIYLIQLAVYGILILSLCHLFHVYFTTQDKIGFEHYLHGFNYWVRGMLGMWWYTLWVFLWSLLFIIPGIVKSFAYSQMFFIMAENPHIRVSKAMKISKVMTKGFKGDLFLLGLSFIGWEILSLFTAGILQLWIIPYQMMTFTNAYKDMKAQAIKTGVLSLEDFI